MAKVERGQELASLYDELRKGVVRPLYLLYGDQEFLVSQGLDALQKTLLQGIPVQFNFDSFHGPECDVKRLLECLDTLPMMAPRRIVLVRELDALKDAALEKLLKYLNKPSPTTVLVATGGAMKAKKVVDAFRKHGLALELKTLYERQLRVWLKAEATRIGKTLDDDAVGYMLDMVGDNLRELHSELVKLSLYVGKANRITRDDLKTAVSDVSLDSIFEFNNAVGARDVGTAMMQLSRLIERDNKAQERVIPLLHRHFQSLYRARLLLDAGMDPEEVARQTGTRDNMIWKWKEETLPQIRARNRGSLETALRVLFEGVVMTRSSKVPAGLTLDAMVMRLCAV